MPTSDPTYKPSNYALAKQPTHLFTTEGAGQPNTYPSHCTHSTSRLHVIGHGILVGKYLAKYRDSLIQLFADVSGDRRSLGSFATSSQMMTEGKSHTW